MKANLKPFQMDRDFLRVRDFLSQTYHLYGRSMNWRIERWEYAIGFVTPFLANWGENPPLQSSIDQALQFMDEYTALWETDQGEIAGVVTIEHPDTTHPSFGEFFIQRHPDHLDLIPTMLDFAKNHLAHPETNELYIYTDPEDGILVNKLIEGGFTPNSERTANESIFDLTRQALPDSPSLPKGFRLQSMAEDNDLAKRCEAFGRGFNHPEPLEWPSLKSYELLQTMPDYLPEQDIVVVSPDGQFVAFCLIWRDQPNKLASLEPVGTHPDFRRLGLAREAIYEAMRRVRDMGIETVIVGSDQTFYQKIGFKVCEHRIRFEIKAT
jgi:ribosomal protein S18 acetylase RimI-like enzyme